MCEAEVCSSLVSTHITISSIHISTLHPTQEQMFQLWQRDPTSMAYNSGFTAMLEGPLDVAALQAAARLVFERQQVSSCCSGVSDLPHIKDRVCGTNGAYERQQVRPSFVFHCSHCGLASSWVRRHRRSALCQLAARRSA